MLIIDIQYIYNTLWQVRMKTKTCCFAGHSDIYDRLLTNKIKKIAVELIEKENVSCFWVGNYGDFDKYSATTIRELKNEYPYISLELIIPYLTKEIILSNDYSQKFDNILVAEMPENTPKKFQILKCNEYMVKKCDFLVCYVKRSYGGAYKTLEAARKNGLQIINLCEKDI